MSGKWAVAATLSLFVVVPAITFGAWRLMEADLADVEDRPLVWSERETWPAYDVKAKPLERGIMSQGRTGQTYKDYGFHPSTALIESIARCRALAEGDAFGTGETHDALLKEFDAVEGHFYAAALLALWYEQAALELDDAMGRAEAERWWGEAFALAPAAVVQRVAGLEEGPVLLRLSEVEVPGVDVGTVSFAFDTVDAETDTIDTSLVLVYPGVRTDGSGWWRLPVFKTIFRIVDPALGAERPNDPRYTTWLTHVGKVGRLPAIALDGVGG